MFKNVSGQKLIVFAFDATTNLPKSGDAANITAYVSKDHGSVTVLGDTSATELDATNAKGYYRFDLTQAETNADVLLFTAKSSTANVVVIGAPARILTGVKLHATGLDDVVTVPPRSATVTITIASPGVVTWTAHGLTADQPVILTTTGALPTGLTAGTKYYVISAGLTANTFQLAATVGGAAINTSGTQSGTHTAAAGDPLNARQAIAAPVVGLGYTDGNSTTGVTTSPPAVGTPAANPSLVIVRDAVTGDKSAVRYTPST